MLLGDRYEVEGQTFNALAWAVRRQASGFGPRSLSKPRVGLDRGDRGVGSDTWIRTTDPLINSQLLYR
jgi:hypothetical protein